MAAPLGCSDLPAEDAGAAPGPGQGQGDDGPVGEATFELTSAPAGALCVRITVTPATGAAIVKTFSVMQGTSTAALSLGVLPVGQTSFTGDAFAAACTAITSATSGWTSDTVSATIRAGAIANVALTFRPRNPVNVSANFLKNLMGVVASGSTSYALTDGSPMEWGEATGGWNSPTLTSWVPDATAFAAGYFHGCNIRKDGTVWCWGQNTDGQVGPGIPVGSAILDQSLVPLPGPATLVSAGGRHSCAYVPGSGIYCWGSNSDGQLGNGGTASSATPVLVTNSTFYNIRALSGGTFHNIVTTGDGHYLAWGRNSSGQYGDGTTNSSRVAIRIIMDDTVVGAAAGDSHSCNVHADGSVWCWGDNAYGQLGDGTNVPHRMPARVTGLSGATQVSAGEFHSCARLGDGRVACWGKNSDGEIGDLTATHRWAPVFVNLGSDTALTVTSGFSYNCVMTAALGATCWGYNGFGQIGDGTFNNAWSPVKITLQ
jgi:hypothetical protein